MRRDIKRLDITLDNLCELFPKKFKEKVEWIAVKEIISKNLIQKRKEYLVNYFWDYSIEELQDLVTLASSRAESARPVRNKPKTKGPKRKVLKK
jgi:hypothetical protein